MPEARHATDLLLLLLLIQSCCYCWCCWCMHECGMSEFFFNRSRLVNWGKQSLTVQTVVRCTQSDEHFFPWSSWFKVLFRKHSSRFLSFLTGIMSAVEATQFFMVAKYQHFPATTRRREWIVLGQDGSLGFFRITQRPGCGIYTF